MLTDQELEMQLGRLLKHVYGEDIYDPEFVDYLETLPALFRMYEFSQVYHNPAFKKFLVGLPRLINLMGVGAIH